MLSLVDDEGRVSTIKVSLKYIPVQMRLDPSESINNMGRLRVDVLDAADLPSADRNGYSDPYCKFELNGASVFKTKVQKKTLHPAWNEFFEVEVPSRTAARFNCRVMDWDFGDKADFLGGTDINLELLEPFKAQEYTLALDGKSGTIRLRLLFRPDYVTRSRQGSSTFSGTFAAPGKIVTNVAGAPVKGVGFAAAGVGKGASFLLNGFRSKKKDEEVNVNGHGAVDDDVDASAAPNGHLRRASGIIGGDTLPVSATPSSHSRTKSFGASSRHSISHGHQTPESAPTGTAYFTIVSATGFPPSTNLQILLKPAGSGSNTKTKPFHVTDHIKSSTGSISFNEKKESFRVPCTPDTPFLLLAKHHSTFGRDDDLGEALVVIDDSVGAPGREKSVVVGSTGGTVVLRTGFEADDSTGTNGNGAASTVSTANGALASPEAQESSSRRNSLASGGFRKSLLKKGTSGDAARASRDVTPVV